MQNNHKLNEMAALEERQQHILNQLAELKKQMISLKEHLKVSNNSVSPVKKPAQPEFLCPLEVGSTTIYILSYQTTFLLFYFYFQMNKLPDLVINASPAFPPYSLRIIQKLWKDLLHVSVKTHIHSSVSCLPEAIASFAASLESFQHSGEVPKINVRLIWKNGKSLLRIFYL